MNLLNIDHPEEDKKFREAYKAALEKIKKFREITIEQIKASNFIDEETRKVLEELSRIEKKRD